MAGEDRLREYLRKATVDLGDTRRKLAEVQAQTHEPIAVVGMSCRFPGAGSVDAYWDLLEQGRSAVLDEVPDGRFDLAPHVERDGVYTTRGAFLDDVAGWDARFFGSSPQEALRMDPQQRLLMELTWEALEDAGTPPPSLAGSRTGVMIGFSDILQYLRIEKEREGDKVLTDPYAGQGASASVVAGRLAYHYDLRGPALTLDTACSSSLVAVHLAGSALRRGECDLAVAAAPSCCCTPTCTSTPAPPRCWPPTGCARPSTRAPTATCSARAPGWSSWSGSPTRSAAATGCTRSSAAPQSTRTAAATV